MKKQTLFLLIAIINLNCFSQISFEKGYYIDNANQKINCFIKNIDWVNNPKEFEYKRLLSEEPTKISISSVKEFGVYKHLKFVRKIVNIDRSFRGLKKLSYDRNPLFKEEQLFLKVLFEGKSNLYVFVEGNLKKYFYTKDNSDVEQLIFKKYKVSETRVKDNNRFRQQLWNNLKCSSIKIDKVESLKYKKNDLINFFTEYNECHNVKLISYEKRKKRDLFNLTIRPRLNNSSLTLENSVANNTFSFDNYTGFGVGLEAEFILAYNKNKWSILIEAIYQQYKSKGITDDTNVGGGKIISELDYNSIELPIGLRHYFFINNNSKFFTNASLVFDFSSKSSINQKRSDGSTFKSFDVETSSNFVIGFGYKYNDKYSLEIRQQTGRELVSSYSGLSSSYKTFSIVFGYSLF